MRRLVLPALLARMGRAMAIITGVKGSRLHGSAAQCSAGRQASIRVVGGIRSQLHPPPHTRPGAGQEHGGTLRAGRQASIRVVGSCHLVALAPGGRVCTGGARLAARRGHVVLLLQLERGNIVTSTLKTSTLKALPRAPGHRGRFGRSPPCRATSS